MKKRLNNKGFTLIELLAVVVILAVVMGIAMTSVLSAMNKSRGGSLADTAMIVANAFNQKYTESLVGGVPSNVYGDVLVDTVDDSGNAVHNGYNFQSTAIYYLDAGLADTFNISGKGYAFANDTTNNENKVANVDTNAAITSNTVVSNSFVTFNVQTGKFIVCMFANNGGSYYVDNYKVVVAEGGTAPAIGSTGLKAANGTMYACSDGAQSWK